jgi:CO dehydrogenase maturation factor
MKLSVCGKGGSGKSTVVALLAHQGLARNLRVLVVDSDESNSGLYRMLGLENPPAPLMELVGGKANLKEGMSRSSLLNAAEFYLKDIPAAYLQGRDGLCQVSIGKILQALEGCACPMGVLSREFLKKLRMGADEVAIIDMEAGIEHFGRGIDEGIDRVLMVVEPSLESMAVAEKIKGFASGMNKKVSAVLNKTPSEAVAKRLKENLDRKGIEIIGVIPEDPMVSEACLEGRVYAQGIAYAAAGRVLDRLL